MRSIYIAFLLVVSAIISFGLLGSPAGKKASSSEEFKAQMEVIIKDYNNHFANIIGEMNLHESDGDDGYLVYNSLVQLGNAEELLIENDIYNKTYSFYAGFPGSPDIEITLKAYRALIDQIESLKITYYPLMKGEDKVEGNKHQLIFVPDPGNSQLDPAYKDIIIVLYLDRAIKTNNDGQIVWLPFIKIL